MKRRKFFSIWPFQFKPTQPSPLPTNIPDLLAIVGRCVRAIETIDRSWRTPHIDDSKYDLLIIEAGSTGIHKGMKDKFGYWVFDGDMYPSHPLLVKRVKERA